MSYHYVGLGVLLAKGRRAVLEAVTESCEDLVGKAQEKTPVDTGTLRASIHVDSVVQSGLSVTGTVVTGGEADYAQYVEGGTYKMNGVYYMRDALQENIPAYRKAVENAARGEF